MMMISVLDVERVPAQPHIPCGVTSCRLCKEHFMRIRTAAAAAVLATAAVLGSAGSALAWSHPHHGTHHCCQKSNHQSWEYENKPVAKFTKELLSHNANISDNDNTHNQNWDVDYRNVSDNVVDSFNTNLNVGGVAFVD
ncbi:hypothetical protein DEH18_33785 [Streptomyces sp. NHF165]|nr:hypothetical protein DEH18_33785 [Streptomyces sp. NHF165]